MHIDRRPLRWGVFLIALGLVPLAVQLGWLDRAPIVDAERLWPVALIAIGIGVILDRTRIAIIGTVVGSIVFGLLIGGVLSVGVGALGCPGAGGPTTQVTGGGILTGPAEVSVTFDCGTSSVETTPGATWSISGTAAVGHVPVIDAGPASLRIRPPQTSIFDIAGGRSDWRLLLPTDPIYDATFVVNASDARLGLGGTRWSSLGLTANASTVQLDLSEAQSTDLSATVNAGDLQVKLPGNGGSPGGVTGSITVNAGHLGLCLPADGNLAISLAGVLSSNNFAEQGMFRDGSTWRTTSPAFNSGSAVILQVTANAGTIELNAAGGCQ
ncbi:MAG: LiaI-LiaF-like domain-containing protein [Candidatus Limnocylindrales bacterium]